MLGLIASDMWVEVEGLLMISVYDATNGVLEIGSTVRLQCSFVKVVLIFGVGQGTSIGLELFDVFLYFIASLLLPASLLLNFAFANASS
jgi:hypothetical protein